MKIFKVGLVGVTGYTGMELARLLASHPRMKLEMACSRTESGLRLGEFYPFLEGLPGSDVVISIFDAKEAARRCDLVFLAVPHGKAMEMAGELLEAGTRVIDLSADFRLRDVNVYEDWYVPHTRRELLPEAVYGLPELYAAETAKARLVANPGCYPSSAILGLYAAFKHGLISPDNIVIDSKSGTSGAGRKPVVPSLFCEVYDTFRAYGLGKHRHTPEIEQEYSRAAGCDVRVSFNPHLVPMVRGILSTIYTTLRKPGTTLDEVHAAYSRDLGPEPLGPRAAQGQAARDPLRARQHVLRPRPGGGPAYQPPHRGLGHRQPLPRRLRPGPGQCQPYVRPARGLRPQRRAHAALAEACHVPELSLSGPRALPRPAGPPANGPGRP